METLENSNSSQFPSSHSPSKSPNSLNPSFNPSTPSPSSSRTQTPFSNSREWRPRAQRNLRNQWSSMSAHRQKWASASSTGRSQATALVNAYLSQKYMSRMELGVLNDMPDIRKRANWKLFKQQELHRFNLLSSYKNLVSIVNHMVNASRSMKYYLKVSNNSAIIQYSNTSSDMNNPGDGGGIPVFAFWTISYVESLAHELVQIFASEVSLKRLLVVELLSISSEELPPEDRLCWSNELYTGEFDDLKTCSLYCTENSEPLLPKNKSIKSTCRVVPSNHQPDQEVLQLYLTTWLAEVNIDTQRVDEIFSSMGEEMHVNLS